MTADFKTFCLLVAAVALANACDQGGKKVPVGHQHGADAVADCDHQHMGLHGDDDHDDDHDGDMGGMSMPGDDHHDDAHPPAAGASVTYAKDVAPILEASCTSCHYPGTDEGPDLSTYATAKAEIAAILRVVALKPGQPGFMPEGGKQQIPAAALATLKSWSDGGLAEGAAAPGTTPTGASSGCKRN